jgi:hypothetical protein
LHCWFKKAGIEQPTCQTFIGEVQAPLSSEIRLALVSLFGMLWSEPNMGSSRHTWREYKRLCDPELQISSRICLYYYAFFTYTMFSGTVEKTG